MKIIMLFLLSSTLLFSQVVTVVDKNNDLGIDRVMISSIQPKALTFTNENGEADLSNFRGSERITFKTLGYKSTDFSYDELREMNFKIELDESNISFDQVVVSATKWRQDVRITPSKVASIPKKEIELQNPQTAADLLTISGEVFVQKSQMGGGSPMIRGFSTNRLLITVDGVRMNTAIFRSGNVQNVISIDPFTTKSTEVLFGPGSVIYGSDAIGGVMNFFTLQPEFSVGDEVLVSGNATSRYSSANQEVTNHFDVNVGWKNFASVTSFSHFNFNDLRMGTNGPDEYLRNRYVQRISSTDEIITNEDPLVQRPTGYEQTNLMQKFRYKPSENWNIELGLHYSATTDYARYDRLLRNRGDVPRSAEWYYGPQVWNMNNLQISNSSSNLFYDNLEIRITNQFFEESRFDRDFNDIDLRKRVEEVDVYSANVDMKKSIGERNNLLYGLEWVRNDVHSTGQIENIETNLISGSPSRYPESDWSSYAAYATWQSILSDKFTFQFGARYNAFDLNAVFDTTFYKFPFTEAKIQNGALTGSTGLVWSPDASWMISLNLSTGFRAPNVDDVGKIFDSEPGSVVVPNPDLQAEYAYNAEFGAAKIIGDFLKIDGSLFYTVLDQAMVRRNFTLNGQDSIMYDGELSQVQAIQNASIANVYGVQAGFEWKLPYDFAIASRFNYQFGEEELDDGTTAPLRHAAPWFGNTRLTYYSQKVRLELYANYSGEVSFEDMPPGEIAKDFIYAINENGNPYAPAWYTLNFKAMYYLSKNLSVIGGIENITDERYRPYSSGIVAPGRNIIMSLKVDF